MSSPGPLPGVTAHLTTVTATTDLLGYCCFSQACQSELIAPPVSRYPSLFLKVSGVQLHLQQQNLLRLFLQRTCSSEGAEPQQGKQAELCKPFVGKAIWCGTREGSWPARLPLLFTLGKRLVRMQPIALIHQKSDSFADNLCGLSVLREWFKVALSRATLLPRRQYQPFLPLASWTFPFKYLSIALRSRR